MTTDDTGVPRPAVRRVPVATYRLQLGPDLPFDAAADLVPYLTALGITDCYTSPFFETSSRGSHGYDVADHNHLREELGGEPAFLRFAEALKRHAMGLTIDIVPNHMGIAGTRNAWWMDVLRFGPRAATASFFDIDWTPLKRELADKVLLPILGDQYGVVLDSGQLKLDVLDGEFVVRYYDTILPISPATYGRILGLRIEQLQGKLGAEADAVARLKSLITWFVTLVPPVDPGAASTPVNREDFETGRRQLADLIADSPEIREFIAENLRLFNGTPGDAKSFDPLDSLLANQAYRLAFWRVAGEEINYRRFFDINELAAIRMEDPAVFAATHRLVFRLVGEGIVTGLRIDHPDGLYAPAEYFARLQRGCSAETATDARASEPFYIVAEKILADGERLPASWAVAGTTGYEFLNVVNGIFVDRAQRRAFDDLYARLVPQLPPFPEIVHQCKRLIMESSMASELNMLANRLNGISERHRSSRDFTLASLTRALREIVACFPVYRTYFGEADEAAAAERDRDVVNRAVSAAQTRTAALNVSVFDWTRDVLSLRFPAWCDEADRRERTDWVMRLQQITGPVTAKGYEDTALYRYHRLVSLNEVGADPGRFGTSLLEFHAANLARRAQSPDAMSATATHDTKRGEDVRAHINVLSEIPRDWRARVSRWQRLNRKHRTVVDGEPVPGANEEYLIYQTLVGAWPITPERLRDYMLKAAHEAKQYTSWINPNAPYDAAMTSFVEAILDPARSRLFLRDFAEFHGRVARFGVLNSLAQTLIKITAPGIPDFYQGTELIDLSLVDPDNRRPVDFARRRELLDALTAAIEHGSLADVARGLLAGNDDGRLKLYVIRQALHHRRRHAALFRQGDYRPVEATGALADHLCAFLRSTDADTAITIVPRLLARRGGTTPPLGAGYWGDTVVVLPPGAGARFRNVFTGQTVVAIDDDGRTVLSAGEVFAAFPMALLERAA